MPRHNLQLSLRDLLQQLNLKHQLTVSDMLVYYNVLKVSALEGGGIEMKCNSGKSVCASTSC